MRTVWESNRFHHGVVLDTSIDGFDGGGAGFGSVFMDDDDPKTLFMFYSGAEDPSWSRSTIGLAISQDCIRFRKVSQNPLVEGTKGAFYYKEALTPAVTKIGSRFFMVFSGRPSTDSFRRLGLAWADDPRGPWHVLMELPSPLGVWGSGHRENGPSLAKLDDDTVLVFCSNTSSAGLDPASFFRHLLRRGEFSPAWIDIPTFFRRYLVRKIGVLKLKIHGTSKSDIEVYKSLGNSLRHLNGPKGSWNESLFCPGYFHLSGIHYLVPATSVYSSRDHHRRYIGIAAGDSPYFNAKAFTFEKLIDGPSEKSEVLPGIKGEISLDSPSPFLSLEDQILYLYYSVMDSFDSIWKTALTTFSLKEEQKGMK